jgi:hypothetical protein
MLRYLLFNLSLHNLCVPIFSAVGNSSNFSMSAFSKPLLNRREHENAEANLQICAIKFFNKRKTEEKKGH